MANDNKQEGGNSGAKAPVIDRSSDSAKDKVAEFEIELGCKRNRKKTWPPTQQQLRGAWIRANLTSDERSESLEGIPDIPGIRIRISAMSRKALIYDPLGLPENAEELKKVQAAFEKVVGGKHSFMESIKRENMSETEIKTWVYWAMRLVASEDAKVTRGSIPSPQEIESMPGMTEISQFDSASRKNRFRETADKWMTKIEEQYQSLSQKS